MTGYIPYWFDLVLSLQLLLSCKKRVNGKLVFEKRSLDIKVILSLTQIGVFVRELILQNHAFVI